MKGDALYALRRAVDDPENVLQSWDPTLVDPCTWFHVTCDADNRVTRLWVITLPFDFFDDLRLFFLKKMIEFCWQWSWKCKAVWEACSWVGETWASSISVSVKTLFPFLVLLIYYVCGYIDYIVKGADEQFKKLGRSNIS